MASLVLTGDTSGQVTIAAPAVAGTNTLTLQAATATNAVNTLGTAVSASGTAIDFTALPSWVKRITVMLDQLSTNGTSQYQFQIGTSGGIQNTGYVGCSAFLVFGPTASNFTSGWGIAPSVLAADTYSGQIILSLLNSSTGVWTCNSVLYRTSQIVMGGGSKTLSGTLDRVRITTVNGTDTFDAGSVNILYEG